MYLLRIVLTVLLWLGCTTLLPAQSPASFPHVEQWKAHQSKGELSEAEWDEQYGIVQTPRNERAAACTLSKAVYGWHPYWMGTAYNSYDWNLLSTFSYFSYEVNPNTGNYNSIHAWKTTNSIDLAQAAGCKVELCATLFGATNNTTFLTNPTARQTFIDSIITLVQYRNADGVNIDFEGTPGAQRANFTSFMQDLSSQLKTAVPGASLTMALYAVDWNSVFDIAALDPVVDQFIIMGYGYHYSGSATAGPTAPLYSGAIWWAYNLNRSVLYYLSEGVTPEKLLVGLPYYGNEYQTASGSVPSASNAFVSARTYSYIRNNYTGVQPRHWDPHSLSPAHIFQVGGLWHQSWVDDEVSLAEKFDLVHHRNIGGIGIWALGYDNGYTELWDLIEEKFSDCGTPLCGDTLYDSGGPLGNYRNNEDYHFTLQSPAGESVRATFLAFDLEANYDYVYVYDGADMAAPLIGQYSGTTAPGPFLSTGDALTFRFTTDGATIASGYQLAWNCEGPPVYADTIRLNRNDSALLDCGLPYHVFLDSDAGLAGDYANGESNTMTFCSPDPAQGVRLTFNMQTPPVQLDLKSTVNGNDYLYIWDGPDTLSNLKAVYTGSTNSYPQPGTIKSTGQCLTARFESDAASTGQGWVGTLRCTSPPVTQATQYASAAAPLSFTDTGGSLGNYGNNESWIRTFCPDVGAAAAGEVIIARMDSVFLEQNYDYLHVYDGDGPEDRLIGTFTGNDLNQNDLQTILATVDNPSGCLTFEFYSDGATTAAGWDALITSGQARETYGAEGCGIATLINQGGVPYAGSTTLATGRPNAEDPPLNIELLALPECSGANAITRLENSIWYRFTTPSTPCPQAQIDIELRNIACQNSIPGGNGAQFTIYEVNSCQTGAAWGNPIYCSDKLLANFPVNIAGLLQPSQTYYIMIDGFAGQHCNMDLVLLGDITDCILPIEMLSFTGKEVEAAVQLDWETAFEENNRGFHVQRGQIQNGTLAFADIGFVPANGGTEGSYQFLDPGYLRGQVNHYRLRQEDLNGQSHFHRILQIAPEGVLHHTLAPNPFSGSLELSLGAPVQQGGRLDLYDLEGRMVHQEPLSAGQQSERMDLGHLPAGVYLYRLQVDGQLQQGKLIRH